MRPNPLRDRFAAREVALGGWLAIPSSLTAEAMAATDLDYICIDMQHGLVDYSDSVPMLQSLTLGTATPTVRVPENTPSHISKALDAGAMAIIVPMVNSREECVAAVESSFYAPKGGRSYGPTRAAAVEGADYYQQANSSISCIPMVETVAAMEDLDGILSVDGIDAIYVGPNDLRISMGLEPNSDTPEFVDALREIVAACERHDVVPGIHATPGTTQGRVDLGFRMVTVTADMAAMKQAIRQGISVARGNSDSNEESLY